MLKDIKFMDKIKKQTVEIIVESDLNYLLQNKKCLSIKVGFDPTSPHLHLGHFLLFQKMKDFQDLGHSIIFLLGDFTASIGDPTGRLLQREKLKKKIIYENCLIYINLIKKFLDYRKTRIIFNSFWFNKLTVKDIFNTLNFTTLAQMLKREDFYNRYRLGYKIQLSEFLYPILQGLDSVFLMSDIEIGGIDQKFNFLLARELQKCYNQKPQVAIMLPILEGLDGVRKMSKTYNNCIFLDDTPQQMFGKLMSISDKLMWSYAEKLDIYSISVIDNEKKKIENGKNPRDFKIELSFKITQKIHGLKEASLAKINFFEQFIYKVIPTNLEIKKLPHLKKYNGVPILYALKNIGLTKSTSEALRLVLQKSVYVDGFLIVDKQYIFIKTKEYLLKVGKKFFCKLLITD